MKTFGLILFWVGTILFIAARVIYKKNERDLTKGKQQKSSSDNEFLMLLKNSMNIIKIVGSVLIILGALIIIFMGY